MISSQWMAWGILFSDGGIKGVNSLHSKQASWLKAVMRLQLVILADCFMPEQQHARLVPQGFCGGISSMEYSMLGSLWLCDSQRFAIQALMG
jgi:hypothetical protein